MRRLIVLAAAAAALGSAQAEEQVAPTAEFTERVRGACIIETARRDTHTADHATVVRYCQCTMGAAHDGFTPPQFDVFGRYGLSRTSDEPAPTEEEMRALETPDFTQRVQMFQTRIARECNSILWPEQR
jgi:hypothetical protein